MRARKLSSGAMFVLLNILLRTSAIRYHNGSIFGVAKVYADEDYLELVKHLGDPPRYVPGSFMDRLERARRQLNKSLGRPASRNVEILSKFIKRLWTSTMNKLQIDFDTVVISLPQVPGHNLNRDDQQEEDIKDALDYIGLGLVNWCPNLLRHSQAAFAGYGLGLCKDYIHVSDCWAELQNLPLKWVLIVIYTHAALGTTLSGLNIAVISEYYSASNLDWEAGSNMLSRWNSSEEYWAHVKDFIQQLPREWPFKLTSFLLAGEDALDEKFYEVVTDALQELYDPEPPQITMLAEPGNLPPYVRPSEISGEEILRRAPAIFDPLAAAKGAAEIAKRFQESPNWCEERACCRKNREPKMEFPLDNVEEL